MNFCINRNMTVRNIHYYIKNYDVVSKANITLGMLPIKIEVLSNNHIILKQSPWILKLINALPLLNYETFTPFKLYKNGVKCGKGKHLFFKPVFIFVIDMDRYEIRHHSNNYISIMRNDKQIALFQKKLRSVAENNTYFVKCINENGILDIIMLFCAFIDVMFYPNNKHIAYIKEEKTYILNDKHSKRIQWSPPRVQEDGAVDNTSEV